MFLKNKLLLFLFTIFLGLILSSVVLSYNDTTTHPKLTHAIIDFYNQKADKKVTKKQANWIVQGSIKEDSPVLRCKNHFYNPQTGQGLNKGKYKLSPGIPAPKWSNSSVDQSKPYYLGDYSWQTAIYNYQQGNYEKAFISLGHVLHLLEDMAVPAHVRSDAHEEGDPFEDWAKENNQKVDINLSKVEWKDCQAEEECLKDLSKYTNNNFLSKDTTNNYNNIINKNELYLDKNDYLIIDGLKIGRFIPKNKKIVFDKTVHESYWNHLSPKVVGYGAGLIDLFFREVKNKKVERPEIITEHLVKKFLLKANQKTKPLTSAIYKTKDYIGDFSKKAYHYSKKKIAEGYNYSKEKVVSGYKYSRNQIAQGYNFAQNNLDYIYEQTEKYWQGLTPWKEAEELAREGFWEAKKDFSSSFERGSEEEVIQSPFPERKRGSPEEDQVGEESLKEKEPKEEKITKEKEDEEGEGFSLNNSQSGRVVGVKFVYDGDTILLESGERVRYLGIDSPELNDKGSEDDECLAWEARLRNMELLSQGEVRIIKDPGADKDKYGRLLRYVYVEDNFLNKILVREGLAEPFFCQPGWENCALTQDKQKKQIILSAHKFAQNNGLGLYSSACIFSEKKNVVQKKEPEKKEYTNFNKKNKSSSSLETKNSDLTERGENIHILGGGDKVVEIEAEGSDDNSENKSKESGDIFDPPQILAFRSYDLVTGNKNYTSSTTVGLDYEIKNKDQASFFLATTCPQAPLLNQSAWQTTTPEFFRIASHHASQNIYTYLKYNHTNSETEIIRASSSIEIKKQTQAPQITNLRPREEIYWLNNNEFNLSGSKGTLTQEIIINKEGSTSSFSVATGTDTWSLDYDFEFECPEFSFREQENCPQFVEAIMSGQVEEFLTDFHKKNIFIKGEDIFGIQSSSTQATFKLDLSPPQVLMTAQYHSNTSQDILLGSGIKENFLGMPAMPGMFLPRTYSGIKKKQWWYKLGEDGEWKEAETDNLNLAGQDLRKFSAEFGKNYYFKIIPRDYAGNVSLTSVQSNILNFQTATSSYPVISEIYPNASTTEAGGEWIEFYNPSNEDISLTGYSLDTQSYTSDAELPASSTIPAQGFFLLADQNWTPDDQAWPEPDYKETITLKNSGGFIRLRDDQGREVDYLEYSALNELESQERKAYIHSTQESMSPGGAHYNLGNGWDTNDDYSDWLEKDTPEPQNSQSNTETWEF